MSEQELTKEEVELLGRLLRGEQTSSPLRAATRLVKRVYAQWTEPDGSLELLPRGRAVALQLWPDVAPADPSSVSAADSGPPVSTQISLLPDLAPAHRTTLGSALARVLGGGAQAEQLAEIVLEHYPQGRGLSTAPRRALQALGLAPAQARNVVEAFALARACERRDSALRIDGPEQMAREIFHREGVGALEVECFWVAALDSGRRVIAVTCVAKGGPSRVDVVVRDVFVPLVRARATAAYIAHNHPSGDPRWSDSDVRLTQRVMAAGERLGIEVVDHLVLAPDGSFVSMEQEGAL